MLFSCFCSSVNSVFGFNRTLPDPWLGRLLLATVSGLLRLKFDEVLIQTVEALFPELSVLFDPIAYVFEWLSLQPAWSPLRLSASRDQPRTLKHFEVFRDGWKRHVERTGELFHRCITRCEPGQNGPSRRIGEGGKRGTKKIGAHLLVYQAVM